MLNIKDNNNIKIVNGQYIHDITTDYGKIKIHDDNIYIEYKSGTYYNFSIDKQKIITIDRSLSDNDIKNKQQYFRYISIWNDSIEEFAEIISIRQNINIVDLYRLYYKQPVDESSLFNFISPYHSSNSIIFDNNMIIKIIYYTRHCYKNYVTYKVKFNNDDIIIEEIKKHDNM